ncbi:PEP/pyruvate-binding domain-containing protein [Rhodococcus sp. IEGM 1330]|uniref:PEP/pyruvate-binding domain-containing protein n=1 Tax=Rhodococcus sp. IEGM 1330 TaxID=3082225 RepID=UPI0029540B4A|nr:PEP/pyruvate-binding domain-containing protein [Rhodococcus sp. IEGM 1330]MDV8022721.1 PEP/pyruvate-binding domain-containing protein [Rhodococcus sp. IEGM 1330]
MGKYIKKFDEVKSVDRPSVGGKCASLGEMVQAGLPVPDGFAVTVDAYEDFRDNSDLRAELRNLVFGVDRENSASLQDAHDRAVSLVLGRELPAAIESEIREAYLALAKDAAGRRGIDDADRVPVAVRSSSVDEDGDAASFAGQQETYLWVVGEDDVVAKVRECWASLYTPQAIAYRAGMSETDATEASKISVAVQLMADADVAGVTFTVSPRTGDRSVIAINASWGLGQSVVSGEVTPDEFWLTKIGPTLTNSRIATKGHEYVPAPDGSGVLFREVEEARRDIPCLSDAEVLQLAEISLRVEEHYGCPQDIEWALERSADGTGVVMLLQSRPETNWKKRKEEKSKRTSTATSNLLGFVSAAAKGHTR